MTYITSTSSADATSRLGERVAKLLPDGAILELRSDLGGGKTTFVQGLAKGLGYEGDVASPTFTLSRIYRIAHNRELHHFDLYRLSGSDVVTTELEEIAGKPGTITAIEWPETAPLHLAADRLIIELSPSGEERRDITFSSGGPASAAVIEELKG